MVARSCFAELLLKYSSIMSLLDFGFSRSKSAISENHSESDSESNENRDYDQVTAAASVPSEVDESDNETVSRSPKAKKQRKKKRLYKPEYLKYGFICVGPTDLPLPQCLVCKASLSNHSMKPSALKQHFLKNHKELEREPLAYFERLKKNMGEQRTSIRSFTRTVPAAIKSSYIVAFHIAKCKKPYTIAETLLQPILNDVIKEMFGEAAVTKIQSIPLSDTTIMRRIKDMSDDIETQLVSQIKTSGQFSLQFDESVDVANQAILLGFVRYVHEKKNRRRTFFIVFLAH